MLGPQSLPQPPLALPLPLPLSQLLLPGACGALVAVGSGASVADEPQAAITASARIAAIGSKDRQWKDLLMFLMYPFSIRL